LSIILVFLVTGFTLVATSSRGGILAFGTAVILVIGLFVPVRWRLVLVIGYVVSFLVIISYGFSLADQDIVGDTLGMSGRLDIWSRALLAIADYPITGVGFNSFRQVVRVLYPLFLISADIDLAHAHNHLLQAALDLGLPGLVSYLAIWLISCGLLWASWRRLVRSRAQQHPYFALVVGLSGCLLAGWIFGIFDMVALGARPAFLWWMLLGLTSAVHYAILFSGDRLRSRRADATAIPVEPQRPNETPPLRPRIPTARQQSRP
jgi:putative inorganic carbon (HCO3(-)) transporter